MLTKITCVCDTCLYGITSNQTCYKGGIDKCLKNDIYTLYLNKESDKAREYLKSTVKQNPLSISLLTQLIFDCASECIGINDDIANKLYDIVNLIDERGIVL